MTVAARSAVGQALAAEHRDTSDSLTGRRIASRGFVSAECGKFSHVIDATGASTSTEM